MLRLEKHNEHCKYIADQLEAVAYGNVYKCKECGEYINIHGVDDVVTDPGTGDDVAQCPGCKTCFDVKTVCWPEFEPADFFEYWEGGIYNLRYLVDDNLDYLGVKIMIACGGPDIWIDTWEQTVTLYWYGETGSAMFDRTTADAIDELGHSLYVEAQVGRN